MPLQGTPKQVAWGESIRAAAVATIAHRRAVRDAAIAVRGGVDQLTDAERRQIDAEEQAVAWLYAMPAASYWIDRRDESIEDHIIELAKEVL